LPSLQDVREDHRIHVADMGSFVCNQQANHLALEYSGAYVPALT
jgi:hypothetical protein